MLQRFTSAAVLTVLLTSISFADEDIKEAKLGDITLKTPATWKQSEPTSRLRLGQFEIPAAEGDKEAAELAIFNFGAGGGVKANVDRWVGQFFPEGRKSAVTQGKSDLGEYVFVDINGTFKKPIGPPILRKTEAMQGAKMLGIILAVEGKGHYFLKMTGPEKTVAGAADALRASIGAKADGEKPFDNDAE